MQDKEFVNVIKKKEIKVSVIVPFYNVEKYIERAIESVLEQSLKDIEIIIVNDGSKDNSEKLIEKYLEDKRIIYIKQENKGLGAARNTGLSTAKGEYIAFLDSDDYIDNDFYEKLYNSAIKNDADVAAASIIRKRETFEKWRVHYVKNSVYTNKDDIFNAAKYPEQSYVWNKIYKKSFLDRIKFKFQEGVYYEDIKAQCHILLNCGKFITVPDTNYYYMVNDGKSIVKSKKTPKKEQDRYNNQKEAITALIENGVNIDRNRYLIKKREITFGVIPLLKIKEDLLSKREKFFLFNVLPILYAKQTTLLNIKIFFKRLFSVTDIDSHSLLMFLFLKLNIKYKTKVQTPEITEIGVNIPARNPKIIASLTTFPDRINTVSKTVKTLLNQTLKPDELVLYLASEQFEGGENSLPDELLQLKEYGLQIKWTSDMRSYKKLIPALKEYPNDIIITFDDDIYYEKDTIEILYNSYKKDPNIIQANRIWRVDVCKNSIKALHSSYLYWNEEEYKTPSFKNTIIGCGGVLYPPNSLYKDVLDEKKFKEIVPTQDDVWFWGMAVLAGTKIKLNKGYTHNIVTVENTQNVGLCKINNNKNRGASGHDAFNRLAKYYPELLDILKRE